MQQTITLPYLRTSPVHIPRRDLVLSASDSLSLSVIVVESDDPSAQALILNTDINGPAMQLVIWDDSDRPNGWCDYQRPGSVYGTVLQSVIGKPGGAAGSWDFHLDTGAFSRGASWWNFPVRCGWSVLLLWNNGARSSVLAQGIMNILPPFVTGVPLTAIPPDPVPPIIPSGAPAFLWLTTDGGVPIVASDTLKQLETS
jgi:hypothetical protein